MLSALLSHGHDIRHLQLPRGPAALHCMAASAGYEQRRNEVYSWDGMKRGTVPFLVIQHTTLGEGRLDHAGTQYCLTPGRTMLVTVPHTHRYWLDRKGHWEYFWLVLSGREAMRLAREMLDAAGPVLEVGPEAADRLAASCLTLMSDPALTQGRASAAAYSAMTALHDGVFGGRGADAGPRPAPVTRAIGVVEGNLGSQLQIDRLAAVAGMSRAHFVRRFTGAVGQAPSDFVMERRLDRIERLLLATEMTVGQIAAATGFADGNYLAKAFRRRRGMSPLEFRATRAEAN